jgi:uncharacterized Tic20 family protein
MAAFLLLVAERTYREIVRTRPLLTDVLKCNGNVNSNTDRRRRRMLPTTKDDRTWAMLCHIAGLAGYVIPLGNIFGPLIIWMIKKDQSWFVNDQGKEALNFQISLTIYLIVACLAILIIIGIFLIPVIATQA